MISLPPNESFEQFNHILIKLPSLFIKAILQWFYFTIDRNTILCGISQCFFFVVECNYASRFNPRAPGNCTCRCALWQPKANHITPICICVWKCQSDCVRAPYPPFCNLVRGLNHAKRVTYRLPERVQLLLTVLNYIKLYSQFNKIKHSQTTRCSFYKYKQKSEPEFKFI